MDKFQRTFPEDGFSWTLLVTSLGHFLLVITNVSTLLISQRREFRGEAPPRLREHYSVSGYVRLDLAQVRFRLGQVQVRLGQNRFGLHQVWVRLGLDQVWVTLGQVWVRLGNPSKMPARFGDSFGPSLGFLQTWISDWLGLQSGLRYEPICMLSVARANKIKQQKKHTYLTPLACYLTAGLADRKSSNCECQNNKRFGQFFNYQKSNNL